VFLNLLGKVSQKDHKGGRVQLASQLQQAAEAIRKSVPHIEKAWDISEPYMYPPDIQQKVTAEFGEQNVIREVYRLLSDFYRTQDEDTHFKYARCLLFKTDGNLDKLKAHIKLALKDTRDIVAQAEFDSAMNWVRNFNRPFGQEAITQADQQEVGMDDDEFPF
ncbi:MAG: hypothetical protein AAFV07_04075, partial [Bacteroidota bacterium]